GSGDVVMTVTDPSLGFATGGGWFTMENGDRVNFGFEVKATVNKQKTVYQGSVLVIRHVGLDVIKVKGNVFDGYAIQNNTVTFSGKATYSLNGVSSGNFAYTGYGEDNATSGAGADKFGLYLGLSGNQVATAATLADLISSAKLLSGGNIQVPQPQGHK